MYLRRSFVLLLLLGFCLSIQGRMEADFSNVSSSLEFHVSDDTHQHSNSPQKPSTSSGAHKDQHGCYHFHAPFLAVETSYNCAVEATAIVTAALEIPFSGSR